MVFVHDAPTTADLAQTHGQAELQRLTLACWIDVHAMTDRRGESHVASGGDLHVAKVEAHRPLLRREKGFPGRHVGVEPPRRKGGGTSNIRISTS
jgi:hypothetical protein